MRGSEEYLRGYVIYARSVDGWSPIERMAAVGRLKGQFGVLKLVAEFVWPNLFPLMDVSAILVCLTSLTCSPS